MFTGLIQAIGTVTSITPRVRSREIGIGGIGDIDEVVVGESIAVDGACFTVTRKEEGGLCFDISPESLSRTAIGLLARGDRVHLERALRFSDRLGGHLVLGHVDAVGTILDRRLESECWRMELSAPESVTRLLIPKGSVAVNGVSLTVNRFTADGFSVMIVPHTARHTLLTSLPLGRRVNLESDVIGKYVSKLLGREKGGEEEARWESLLKDQGFM